jgi:hypothetical protein
VPVFVRLPSGLVVNLALVRRVVRSDQQAGSGVTVYFGTDDSMLLSAEDATALMKRLRSSTALSSNVKVMIFWFVIIVAVILVWLSLRPLWAVR